MAGLFWADRCALYERVGRPVLVQGDMPSNAQAAGQFQLVIFDGPLEVDWNVGPLSLALRAPSHVLLFARVGRAFGCAATPVSRRAARAVPGTAGLCVGHGTDRHQVHRPPADPSRDSSSREGGNANARHG